MTVHIIAAKPRVLVVEDEPSVRRITRSILEHGGYEVLEAVDGAEALERLAADHDAIDLVLADVHMPRVDGVTLASQVARQWHSLPMLLMSARAADARDALRDRGLTMEVIEKPFRLAVILDAVAEALGGPRRARPSEGRHSAAA